MKSVKTFVQDKQKEYLKGWSNDSQSILDKGLYQWMVSQLDPNHQRVLEIGCGIGNSTLALLKSGKKLISIDENYYCIEHTRKLIEKNGFKVITINDRLDRKLDGAFYATNVKQKSLPNAKTVFEEFDCLLIQSDILQDPKLVEYFKECEIESIICWLIGTHGAKWFDSNLDAWVKSAMEYRLKVQNTVYEVSDEILKEGGVLNIIDRSLYLNDEELKNLIINHKDQASVTKLIVSDKVNQIEFGTPSTNGVGMVKQMSHDTNFEKTQEELWLHSVNVYKKRAE